MCQLEKRNKRLTVALTMMVVAMCAVVTMPATGEKDGRFDTVMAKNIFVENAVTAHVIAVRNDAGEYVVNLSANDDGNGLVSTHSAKGKELVTLNATKSGGRGVVTTYQPNGKALVALGTSDNGGMVYVFNRTGESIAQMRAAEYGNGVGWQPKRHGANA